MRQRFTGFGDMAVGDIMKHTGLAAEPAAMARQRAFTEPGLFDGSVQDKHRFIARLEAGGVHARDGGRFLTLSFGRTKADGMQDLINRMGATRSIALGDAPNDVDMLLAADRAVVVRNDHAPDMTDIPGAFFTSLPGPAGWNEAVLAELADLQSDS